MHIIKLSSLKSTRFLVSKRTLYSYCCSVKIVFQHKGLCERELIRSWFVFISINWMRLKSNKRKWTAAQSKVWIWIASSIWKSIRYLKLAACKIYGTCIIEVVTISGALRDYCECEKCSKLWAVRIRLVILLERMGFLLFLLVFSFKYYLESRYKNVVVESIIVSVLRHNLVLHHTSMLLYCCFWKQLSVASRFFL